MRKKTGIVALPFFIALFFLSLPLDLSSHIQDGTTERFSFIWRAIKYTNTNSFVPKCAHLPELKTYFSQEANRSQQAQIQANKASTLTKGEKNFKVGRVIFRTVNTWNNTLWINLGENDNSPDGEKIIAKGSPILSGSSVIGVIEYVGKKASLVRLISDPSLHVAVRVVRGGLKQTLIMHHIEELKSLVQDSNFVANLTEFETQITPPTETHYLAKGEIHGHGGPLFRGPGVELQGTGFNYEFEDEKGPARDLRSKDAIIQVGDLLVTSGLDGVFPEGLFVAKVKTIATLKEGATSYDITATPCAFNLADVDFVFAIGPEKFQKKDIPEETDLLLEQIQAAVEATQ